MILTSFIAGIAFMCGACLIAIAWLLIKPSKPTPLPPELMECWEERNRLHAREAEALERIAIQLDKP